MSTSVTYMPKSQVYVEGNHESMPYTPSLIAKVNVERPMGQLDATQDKLTSSPLTAAYKRLSSLIASNKDKILTGQLSAADFEAQRENLDHLILIRLYNQLQGEQFRWFHLDNMFNAINVDQLLLRMPFKDNPAAAQKVGRRRQYDTTKVEYDEIQFLLEKVVVSYDIPIEDPLKALIDPVLPLQQSNDYSMAYFREKEALEALQNLKYHYKKDASGAAKFTNTTAPTDNNTQRICKPN